MLVILGGTYIFSPKVKPCLNLWSLFIENSWLTVVLGQNQGEIQPLKEEFETQKINFLEFLGILPMKSLIPARIYTCWSTATFFFFSLSLYDFSRNDGILDRFEKEFIHHLVSWFLFWSCPRSICYVSISAPRLSLGWHPFCLSDLVLNNLWGFQCVNKCASTAVEAALTRKSTTIQPQTGKTPPLKAHDFVWSRSVTHFSALFV